MDSDILRQASKAGSAAVGLFHLFTVACKSTHCPIHDVLFGVLESRVAELIAARVGTIDSGKDWIAIIKRATQKVVQRAPC